MLFCLSTYFIYTGLFKGAIDRDYNPLKRRFKSKDFKETYRKRPYIILEELLFITKRCTSRD